jgi:hypothetical protein
MAKKHKSKSKKPKPSQKVMAGGAVDYGNSLRFLFASVTDAGWRDDIASGNETRITDALTSIGISFPDPDDFDAVVEACQNVHALTGAWNLFDNLRTTLLGPGGSGAA